MISLTSLWLPIVLSAVAIFIASSIIHTVLQWHNSDYPKMPQEDQVMDALRPFSIAPGDYFVPRADHASELKTQEFLDKLNKGPVIVMTVMPNGPFKMGKSLGLWFVYCLIVVAFSACIAASALPPAAPVHHIFHLVAATSFMGFAVALWQMSIWYQRSWVTTLKSTIDGVVYAAITAAIFAYLWPQG